MKHAFLYIIGGLLILTACYKDKGNYDYHPIGEPVVSNLDTAYNAMVGDSFIISPKVVLASGNKKYLGHWQIQIPGQMYTEDYDGQELRIVFGLGASRYPALFTVYDSITDMKYYYKFVINGSAAFTRGAIVLSEDAAGSKISFVKEDGTVQPDVYTSINHDTLPAHAQQLSVMKNANYGNLITGYWATFSNGGVFIDPNNLQKIRTLAQNFYSDPGPLQVQTFMEVSMGVPTAIINKKLYRGATETAPFATYYGYLGVPFDGDYSLASTIICSAPENGGYFLGFEETKRRLVRMDWGNYLDTNYVLRDSAFFPQNLKMNVWHLGRFSDNSCYAFCDSAGQIRELRFGMDVQPGKDPIFHAYEKRVPVIADKISATTLWTESPIGVFYFSQGNKVYRYNPLNKDVKELNTSFGSEVTMLKLLNNGDLLIVGVNGSLVYLDVSTGHTGDKIKQVDGIPGTPKDIIVRAN
ncbi:PKD-like family lipoprotein [Chitinophaga sp. 30R24]|uniref:PKD-like family lipoprotein n=1 Tax=Chitinophaga sp. 30R24 TaxID=3248838 RepID=UPI003B900679